MQSGCGRDPHSIRWDELREWLGSGTLKRSRLRTVLPRAAAGEDSFNPICGKAVTRERADAAPWEPFGPGSWIRYRVFRRSSVGDHDPRHRREANGLMRLWIYRFCGRDYQFLERSGDPVEGSGVAT